MSEEVPMGLFAGSCGKCGAPFYQDSFTGVLKPICCCWNLPKTMTTDNDKPVIFEEKEPNNDSKKES